MDNSKGDYVDLVLCSSPKFLQGGGCPKARKICGRLMYMVPYRFPVNNILVPMNFHFLEIAVHGRGRDGASSKLFPDH